MEIPTRFKHFSIERTCHGDWSVIHIPTRRGVAYGIRTPGIARRVAGAIAGIPIPWGRVTYNEREKVYPKLPPRVRAWLKELIKPYYDHAKKG